MMWTIHAKGAGRRSVWRRIYAGPEEEARRRFGRERARLRTGGHLILATAEGRPLAHFWKLAEGR